MVSSQSGGALDTSEFADLKLHNQYASRLLAFVRKRIPNALRAILDAEEVVQMTFLTYFRGIQQQNLVDPENGDLWPLLVAICRRKMMESLQWHQRGKRFALGQVSLSAPESPSSPAIQLPNSDHTASRKYRIGEVHHRAQQQLSQREREINDARMQGLSDEELQEQFDCCERTIRRAVRRFQELMEYELRRSSKQYSLVPI
jgi:DNA-directed RNA polymerase specialized sigma24 family protein